MIWMAWTLIFLQDSVRADRGIDNRSISNDLAVLLFGIPDTIYLLIIKDLIESRQLFYPFPLYCFNIIDRQTDKLESRKILKI